MEAIMTRIARNELYFGTYIRLEDVVASIDRITVEDIRRIHGKVFGRQELALAALGPLENAGIEWNQ